jgi:hypothetical protein
VRKITVNHLERGFQLLEVSLGRMPKKVSKDANAFLLAGWRLSVLAFNPKVCGFVSGQIY